jgi:hypothetical protein
MSGTARITRGCRWLGSEMTATAWQGGWRRKAALPQEGLTAGSERASAVLCAGFHIALRLRPGF